MRRGRDLVGKDRNVLLHKTSDPFATVRICSNEGVPPYPSTPEDSVCEWAGVKLKKLPGTHKQKTPVVVNTLHPDFHSTGKSIFNMYTTAPSSIAALSVIAVYNRAMTVIALALSLSRLSLFPLSLSLPLSLPLSAFPLVIASRKTSALDINALERGEVPGNSVVVFELWSYDSLSSNEFLCVRAMAICRALNTNGEQFHTRTNDTQGDGTCAHPVGRRWA